MTKELVEVVQADRDAAADLFTEDGNQTVRALNAQLGSSDEAPTVQAFARHRLSAEAAIVAMSAADQIALDGYRAAAAFIGADSWDGCSDCMDILKAAKATDILYNPTPDETALALRSLRSRYWGEHRNFVDVECAARGSVGANDPQECDWPNCGCAPPADTLEQGKHRHG